MSDNTFVARQPIFDRQRRVFGYELLFRSGTKTNAFAHTDGDAASSNVIHSSLNVVGLAELTAHKPAFINITRRLLVEEEYTVLPCDGAVVELLETVAPDDEVVAACAALKDAGYKLALDDFVCHPEYRRLLPFADILKIDFILTKGDERKKIADEFGGKIKLLAEKVETHEEYADGLESGFEYFQGYFFCKPEIVARADLKTFKANYLRFLHALNAPEANFEQLQDIIKADVALSAKLMRYMNSTSMGVRERVSSIKQALAMIGHKPLRRWASIVALNGLSDDKPAELVVACLVRARFCESLAPKLGMKGRELDLFLMGLISSLDALTDRPLEEMIKQMPVPTDVADALMGAQTRLGKVYSLALTSERGNWPRVDALSAELGVDNGVVGTIYRDSLTWADDVFKQAA